MNLEVGKGYKNFVSVSGFANRIPLWEHSAYSHVVSFEKDYIYPEDCCLVLEEREYDYEVLNPRGLTGFINKNDFWIASVVEVG
jgi:hypothetical protein